MSENLSWFPDRGDWWKSWAWILVFPLYPLIPIGAWILYDRYKKCLIEKEKRERTLKITSSILMSKVEYVGGHPLIPQAKTVVVGVSKTEFTIYSIEKENIISPIASVQIRDIATVGTGRPKTAKEIYDEDNGYSIDVIEKSPFLSVIFALDGHNYSMSFQNFEKQDAPQEWSNQIVSLQYKARKES